jgi:hypothetical protein
VPAAAWPVPAAAAAGHTWPPALDVCPSWPPTHCVCKQPAVGIAAGPAGNREGNKARVGHRVGV